MAGEPAGGRKLAPFLPDWWLWTRSAATQVRFRRIQPSVSGDKAHLGPPSLRVLVVDDDILVADTLAMVLNFRGFEAVTAYSGEDAIALARLASYDMLVTDVMMEPMNGIQAALAIRDLQPTCRVLLLSGNERAAFLLQEAHSAGYAFEILAKPVHPTVILNHLSAS
jgi:CheY-like chemotaxis protein